MVMTEERERLGDILVRKGVVNRQQLDLAVEKQKQTGDYLGEILIHMGYADPSEVYRVLARQRGIPYIDLGNVDISTEVLATVPREFAEKYTLLPLAVEGATVKVAVADHLDVYAYDELAALTRLQPDLLLSSRSEIRKAIRENYSRPDEVEKHIRSILVSESEREAERKAAAARQSSQAKEPVEDAPAVRLVELLLQQAIDRKASDMHLEPHKDSVSLRYRIDGILHETSAPTRGMYDAVVSRVKILTDLDIAEHRRPQDGRFSLEDFGVDVRVSIVPTIHGEKVQMRFLDTQRLVLDFGDLGLSEAHSRQYAEVLEQSQGMVMVTGPTGSGKTTTLYSGLAFTNRPEKNIMTVEDPVEYVFPTINQIQVNPGIGLRFSNILRTILRQDPDVIMVGEIRDHETAELAVRASLTGHLVLTTLHTVSAAAAITRLVSMGVQPYLLGSSLSLVIGQRLVRRICHRCKIPATPPAASLEKLGLDPKGEYFQGKGCGYCNRTGYRGRVAVFDLLPVGKRLAHLISAGASVAEIETAAAEEGNVTMVENGAQKIRDGVTTVEEVLAHVAIMGGPPSGGMLGEPVE